MTRSRAGARRTCSTCATMQVDFCSRGYFRRACAHTDAHACVRARVIAACSFHARACALLSCASCRSCHRLQGRHTLIIPSMARACVCVHLCVCVCACVCARAWSCALFRIRVSRTFHQHRPAANQRQGLSKRCWSTCRSSPRVRPGARRRGRAAPRASRRRRPACRGGTRREPTAPASGSGPRLLPQGF